MIAMRYPEASTLFPGSGKSRSMTQHVRNAIARFNQVEGVTDSERDEAWKRIRAAARKFNVELNEEDWRDLVHGGNRKGLTSASLPAGCSGFFAAESRAESNSPESHPVGHRFYLKPP